MADIALAAGTELSIELASKRYRELARTLIIDLSPEAEEALKPDPLRAQTEQARSLVIDSFMESSTVRKRVEDRFTRRRRPGI